jgi:DNA-binding transcriptional MocR family regulator
VQSTARYRALAAAIQEQIRDGRLRPGDRLPPQREFADAHGIAISTAIRVYTDLVKRGLVAGEVGRGTFVRASPTVTGFALARGVDGRVNLATNLPVLPGQAARLTTAAAPVMRRSTLISSAMDPVLPGGTAVARRAIAALAARGGWRPEPERVVFAGNGRQALAATVAALVPPGQRLGVESLSYQSIAAIAARLGVEVVPLPMDEHGLSVEGLRSAHRRHRLRAVYVQPTLHNPLGVTMTAGRRRWLASTLRETGIVAIEDHVCGFLADDPAPLAALAPEHAVMVDSLSKRVAAGITVGWAITPGRLVAGIAESVRAAALVPSGLALAMCVRWIDDGTVALLVKDKRRDAAARQRLLRKCCPHLRIEADPRAYHAWLHLPAAWRAETFTAAAAERGIAVAPGSAFAVGSGRSPNAVRLALAGPTPKVLGESLRVLNALARSTPNAALLE